MKKILSLTLAVIMVFSMIPTAFAAQTDYTNGTTVIYSADASESYTVTVPATLVPGASGTVELSGTWPTNRKITVTADTSVRLTNSINSNDYKDLAVTFAGMEYVGDNTESKTYTETVSVAAMPADALFGTWDGTFYYNVSIEDVATTEPTDPDTGDEEDTSAIIAFTLKTAIGVTYSRQAESGMTWADWIESDYNTSDYSVVNKTDYISVATSNAKLYKDGVLVALTDEIIEGAVYQFSGM